MKISQCETVIDPAKFEHSHKVRLEAYEALKHKLHPSSREAIERLQRPVFERLEKYNQLKNESDDNDNE